LLPGYGKQPVAEVLQHLAATGWNGHVVAEVNTRKAKSETERLALLVETLEFARLHLTVPPSTATRDIDALDSLDSLDELPISKLTPEA
jgi:hypothetical protein